MFWRRKQEEPSAARETDDIAQLQRQFGIKPVSDKDVEAELRKLLGDAASAGGGLLSPRAELAMIGGDESDEETKILRALNVTGNIESMELSSDEEDDAHDDGSRRVAKQELRAVLSEVHATTQQTSRSITSTAVGKRVSREEIHAMKLRAVALKRDGKIKEALALLREVKTLEATQEDPAVPATTKTSQSMVGTEQRVAAPAASMEYDAVDDQDVDVTDEDMQNPEYLAQLASLGLPVDHPPAITLQTPILSLEDEIKSTKLRALTLKREGKIQEALAELRKVKELEARLGEMKTTRINDPPPHVRAPNLGSARSVAPVQLASSSAPMSAVMHPAVPSLVSTGILLSDMHDEPHVEVTDDDLQDPSFDEELKKLGFDAKASSAPDSDRSEGDMKQPTPSAAIRLPSIGDDDLIDEFEEDDEEAATSNASTVTSAPFESFQMEKPLTPIDSVSQDTPVESTGASIDDLEEQLERVKKTAVKLKKDGNLQGALEMMRRLKQIENLLSLKRQQQPAIPRPIAATISPEEQARLARFSDLEELLVRFGNLATQNAKDQLSVNRAKAAEWVAKVCRHSSHIYV
ncbi:hypothetical protein PINS_up003223 [Pythium insidiosum]|nr:hypothetical protein PINS_up003223 [Pythium insidiosum]